MKKYKGFEINKVMVKDNETNQTTKYHASNHNNNTEWWTTHLYGNTILELKKKITKYVEG